MSAYVEFKDVKKIYKTGEVEIHALRDVNFEIEKGEFCVIVGASGAGKTTILNILGGMDTLSGGSVYLDGKEISGLNKRQLTAYRRYDVGFVFQFYNLVQNLTALENVELAAQICKDPLDAATVLKQVGLEDRMANFPAQLSGGEQQRVAIARALAKNPKLLLCDEPTGALDYNTGKSVLKLLQDTCRNTGTTVIVITHNQALTAMADRVITVKSGTVEKVVLNDNIKNVEDADAEYQKYVKGDMLMNVDGTLTENTGAFATGYEKEAKEHQRLHVFVAEVNGETKYVFPVYGAGLWGAIWGYVALNSDKDTVYGVYFSHASETPGLGAEIASTHFQGEFSGKKTLENGEVVLGVVKNGKVEKPDYQVDGISGGTITSVGVDAMLKACLSSYKNFLTNNNEEE